MKFYTAKVDEIGANLKDLDQIVQGKSNNLRVVEDGELRPCRVFARRKLTINSSETEGSERAKPRRSIIPRFRIKETIAQEFYLVIELFVTL